VWLAPCGRDGQELLRDSNGEAYVFRAIEIPGMICMSATNGPTVEGFIGVQLRHCDTPSLIEWQLANFS
jgi:hypothetical protein